MIPLWSQPSFCTAPPTHKGSCLFSYTAGSRRGWTCLSTETSPTPWAFAVSFIWLPRNSPARSTFSQQPYFLTFISPHQYSCTDFISVSFSSSVKSSSSTVLSSSLSCEFVACGCCGFIHRTETECIKYQLQLLDIDLQPCYIIHISVVSKLKHYFQTL